MIQVTCGILQSCLQVLSFEIRHFFEDSFGRQPSREQSKDIDHSNSHASNTWAPATQVRIDRYSVHQVRQVSHLDFSRYLASAQFRNDLQIFRNSLGDVLQGFLFCLTLSMTAREPGYGSGETFLRLFESNLVSHAYLPARENGLLIPEQEFSVPSCPFQERT